MLGSIKETGGDSHIEAFPRSIGAINLLLKLATPAVNGHIDSNMYVIYTKLIIGAPRIMLITNYKLHMQVKRS